jgi:hypothetical protein
MDGPLEAFLTETQKWLMISAGGADETVRDSCRRNRNRKRKSVQELIDRDRP